MLISVSSLRAAILRMEPDAPVPDWATRSKFFSITRTEDELSIIVPEYGLPDLGSLKILIQGGWRILKVHGPLPFSMLGVIEALAGPLAQAGVSIFSLSTYDTDYILVQDTDLAKARQALSDAGHTILDS
jgi:hypothetical protein